MSKKDEQLSCLVQALSSQKALKLAEALEREKVKGAGGGLPIDTILSGLRPKLREVDPEERSRVPTPQRLFCELFESLLVDDDGCRKAPARIDRASLAPVWNWLVAEDGGDLMAAATDLGKAILSGDGGKRNAAIADFDNAVRSRAAEALRKAELDGRFAKTLSTRLGGDRPRDDLKEICQILEISEQIRGMQRDLPPVVSAISPLHVEIITPYFEALAREGNQAASYLVLSLMNRLPKPWNVIGLSGQLLGANDDHELKESVLALVGERLIEDIEVDAARLAALRPGEFDPLRAIDLLQSFAARQKGVTKELGMRKEGEWGKRLLKARGTVSSGLERLFERLSKDMNAIFATRKPSARTKGALRAPDLSRAPDLEKASRAAALCTFLAGTRDFAGQLGYGVAYDKVRTEIDNLIDDFAGLLVDAQISAKPADEEAIEAYAVACEAAMRPLFSHEACQVFGRRMASAKKQNLKAAG